MAERYVKRASILAHLLCVPVCAGVLYLSWVFVDANVAPDLPRNTMAAAMVMPMKVLICLILSTGGAILVKFLLLDTPRAIRRYFFRKHKQEGQAHEYR